MGSSSTSSLSFRILLISTAILSLTIAMNSLLPSILKFAINDIPFIWFVILSWLKPPYLYVVINGIIITIAASSRFHHHYYNTNNTIDDHHQSHAPIIITNDHQTNDIIPPQVFDVIENDVKEKEVFFEETPVFEKDCYEIVSNDETEDKFVVLGSTWNPTQRLISTPAEIIEKEFIPLVRENEFISPPAEITEIEFIPLVRENEFISPPAEITENEFVPLVRENEFISQPAEITQKEFFPLVREKPLVSSRFSNQRRTTKVNPEGVRSLRVAKPKKHETLESTWKAITDGRHIPLNRHLKKSDTFENNHHHIEEQPPIHGVMDYNVMDKSETFNDRTDYQNHRILSPKTALRKEGSLSHDDLNRRVEAFIKKVNDEMRLQREESLKQYMDMINRGAE